MMLTGIITRYGVLAVFLGAGLEGETVVVSGGLLAHEGLLPLIPVMMAAAAGSFLADQFFFLLGRRFRDHPPVSRIMAQPTFKRAIGLLERYPVRFILMFRFLYGLRVVSPIAIGTSAVPVRTFMLLNATAAMLWGTAFSLIGYAFGHTLELILGRLHAAEHFIAAIAGLALIALAAGWLVRRRVKKVAG